MDPLTITTSVGALLVTSGKVVKLIYDLRTTFRDAPTLLTAMIAECATVRTSLSILQGVQQRWLNRPDLQSRDVIETFDTAVTSCALILFVLEEDMQACMKARHSPNDEGAIRRAKVLLQRDHLQELVMQLRGQQQALGLLISSLQSQTIEQIRDNLEDSRDLLYDMAHKAKKLCEDSDHISFTTRSSSQDDSMIISSTATSTRFDFEADLIDSPAYQRAIAYLRKLQNRQLELQDDHTLRYLDGVSYVAEDSSELSGVVSRISVDASSDNSSQTTPKQFSPALVPQFEADDLICDPPNLSGLRDTPKRLSPAIEPQSKQAVDISSITMTHTQSTPNLPRSPSLASLHSLKVPIDEVILLANQKSIRRKPLPPRCISTSVLNVQSDKSSTRESIHRSFDTSISKDKESISESETTLVPEIPARRPLESNNDTCRVLNETFGRVYSRQVYAMYNKLTNDFGHIPTAIVFVGDPACGATAAIARIVQNVFFDHYIPTLSQTYISHMQLGSLTFEVQIRDTAGQHEYYKIRRSAYPGAKIIVLGFSISGPDSLDNIFEEWLPELKQNLAGAPIILAGYKADLRDDRKTIEALALWNQEPVSQVQAMAVARKIKATAYVECSSWTCDGIDHLFEAILQCIVLQDMKTMGLRIAERRTWRKRSPSAGASLLFNIPNFDPTSTTTSTGAKLDRKPSGVNPPFRSPNPDK